MDIGAFFICSHCGMKMFFPGDSLGSIGDSVMSAFEYGWQTIDTADQKLELCPTCYSDYTALIRSFRANTTYYLPNRENSNVFKIYRESDNNGSESIAAKQPTLELEPADTTADSFSRAKAIRESSSDRCKGRQTERDVRKET